MADPTADDQSALIERLRWRIFWDGILMAAVILLSVGACFTVGVWIARQQCHV